MIKPLVFYFFTVLLLSSCATDKFNSSPLSASPFGSHSGRGLEEKLGGSMKKNLNAAEITNLIATFPRFTNDAVNREISLLKIHLEEYLYAYEQYNLIDKEKASRDIERSYKKIQRLRKFLNKDEDAVINRYLVRIKTNITELESSTLLQP